MAKPSRKRDYIFQRPGSSNWYVKLRSPGEKRKEVLLGTSERALAEIIARPMVAEHKAKALAARPRLERNGNVPGYYEREARAPWALFRSLCGKPSKDCSREVQPVRFNRAKSESRRARASEKRFPAR
jgi:hypothetical protein